MTARVNSLINRATEPGSNAGTAWSMPVNDVRAFLQSLECLGYDQTSLLAVGGIRDIELNDPDACISCQVLGAMLAHAQRERFTPNLGLEMAKVTPMGAYPLLDYLVLTSDTVGAGVKQLARYNRLIGNPLTIESHEGNDPIRIEMPGSAFPFSVEFVTSLMMLHFRNETEGQFAAASVSFVHKPDDVAAFERALGCRIESNAPWNGISVDRDAWNLPLRRRDSVLHQVLESRAEDVLARMPVRIGLALEVQRELASRAVGGDTKIQMVARELAMSARTLQRRLEAEGVSYQELREEARKEAAGRYIRESMLTIAEVAYLVGYSEAAPFHRAFKRWYGMTPESFRQKRRGPG